MSFKLILVKLKVINPSIQNSKAFSLCQRKSGKEGDIFR